MPIRQGFVPSAEYSGTYASPYLAPHLVSLDNPFPPQADVPPMQAPGTGPSTHTINIQTPGAAARAGYAPRSFAQDYYGRIHITPRRIELGNLVSEQVREVDVWNAFLTPQTLSETVLEDGDGIDVLAPAALPLQFPALSEQTWQLNVSTSGPSDLDAVLTFEWAALYGIAVQITGARIVPWLFVHEWSQSLTERLAWASDVMQSITGVEQARSLREAPLRSFEGHTVLDGAAATALDLATHTWGGRTWALPIWPDIVWLADAVLPGAESIACATAGRDFRAGGLALLRSDDYDNVSDYEVVEIDEVTPTTIELTRPVVGTWPAGSRLYPLRLADMGEQPRIRRESSSIVDVAVRFEVVEPCDWPPEAPSSAYRGHPVLERAPEWSELPTDEFERLVRQLDNPTGFARRTETAPAPATLRQMRWKVHSRAAQAAYRSLLYWLRGRVGRLWVPSFNDDLEIAGITEEGETALDVRAVGYVRFGVGRIGRRDIRIELTDGSVLYRRIDNATVLDAATERLALDAPPGVQIGPHNVGRLSFMALSRAAADGVEIEHVTDSDGLAQSGIVWRSLRDDV